MKKLLAPFFATTIFLSATSAYACVPSFDSPGDRLALSLGIPLFLSLIYSPVLATFLFFTRRVFDLSFRKGLLYWFKGVVITYFTNAISIFLIATFAVLDIFHVSDSFVIVFVGTMPLVVLSGYFTRVYYHVKNADIIS